jgi:hypothetical protein
VFEFAFGTYDAGATITIFDLNRALTNFSTGNLSVGTLSATTATVTGNISGGNISTGGLFAATGNISGGNISTGGRITATGNIVGDYILGNGSLLSGIITSVSNINNGNSNVSIVNSGGNVDFAVSGVSNVATVSQEGGFGAIFVNGVFSNPRNLSSGNLPDNVNSMLVGPITVGNGVIVGMPDDARLVIM